MTPAPSTPVEGAGRPDTAALRYMAKVSRGRVNNRVDWERTLLDAADWIDTQPPASPADDVPDADAVAFQNGYRIGVRVGSEHHGPCRGLPPASPVPPTPTPCPYIVTGGEGTSYCSLAEQTPTPQADRDKLEIDVEELLIDHCGMGGTSALTDRILALTDAFTFAAAPPSTPAERAPAAIVDDGEVILAAEGDGYVLTVQINEAGDAVSHRLTADEVRTLLAVTPAEQPQPAAEFIGSNKARQEVGDPGHCERCCEVGHVQAHPSLGCGDVGCDRSHAHPTDPTGSEA